MPSQCPEGGRGMAYREVRMMDIEQVMKRWLSGEKIRAIARATGLDRNTVRRLIRFGEQAGLKPGDACPDEATIRRIRECIGRPGVAPHESPIEKHCWRGSRRFNHG